LFDDDPPGNNQNFQNSSWQRFIRAEIRRDGGSTTTGNSSSSSATPTPILQLILLGGACWVSVVRVNREAYSLETRYEVETPAAMGRYDQYVLGSQLIAMQVREEDNHGG
jgi:hypothetical protein